MPPFAVVPTRPKGPPFSLPKTKMQFQRSSASTQATMLWRKNQIKGCVLCYFMLWGLHALGPTVPANTTSAGHQAVRDHGRNKTGLSWVGEWIGEGTGSMFSAGCTDKAKAPAPGFVLCIEGLPPCHPGVSGCCWPGHICIDVSICIAEKRRW